MSEMGKQHVDSLVAMQIPTTPPYKTPLTKSKSAVKTAEPGKDPSQVLAQKEVGKPIIEIDISGSDEVEVRSDDDEMGSDGPYTCDIGTGLSPGTPANISSDGMVRLARTPDTPARIPTGFRLGPRGALQVPASPEVMARCNTRIGSPPEGFIAPYWPPEPGRRVMYPDRGTNTGFYGIPPTPGNPMIWFPGEPEAGCRV